MTLYCVYIANKGARATGKSPTIDVYVKASDGTSAGTPPVITELSGGWYKFTCVPTELYVIGINTNDTAMTDADRYIPMMLTAYDGDVSLVSPIKTKTDTIDWTDITFLKDIEGGKWLRDGTTLTLYKSDNATVVATFNLKKADGTAAGETDDVFERDRI